MTQSPPPFNRTARYFIVGGSCALTNNAVLIVGDWAGGHYAPMMTLSFGIVTALGYLLHAKFTFHERLSCPSFLIFASGVAAGFPISLIVMATLCSGLGMPVIIAAPITTIVLIIWNYVSAHWAILRRSPLR